VSHPQSQRAPPALGGTRPLQMTLRRGASSCEKAPSPDSMMPRGAALVCGRSVAARSAGSTACASRRSHASSRGTRRGLASANQRSPPRAKARAIRSAIQWHLFSIPFSSTGYSGRGTAVPGVSLGQADENPWITFVMILL